jgi:hypothetical protein
MLRAVVLPGSSGSKTQLTVPEEKLQFLLALEEKLKK